MQLSPGFPSRSSTTLKPSGIDGAHILTPMPYLISSGKVTQNNQPTPMYILARLNLDAQCISVAKEYADLKIGVDTAPFKVALDKKKAAGKSIKATNIFLLVDNQRQKVL